MPPQAAEVTAALMKEIEMPRTVGCGNPEPLFGAKNLEVLGTEVWEANI